MVEQNLPLEISSTDFQVMNSMVSKLSLLASATSILTELRSIIYMISPVIRPSICTLPKGSPFGPPVRYQSFN